MVQGSVGTTVFIHRARTTLHTPQQVSTRKSNNDNSNGSAQVEHRLSFNVQNKFHQHACGSLKCVHETRETYRSVGGASEQDWLARAEDAGREEQVQLRKLQTGGALSKAKQHADGQYPCLERSHNQRRGTDTIREKACNKHCGVGNHFLLQHGKQFQASLKTKVDRQTVTVLLTRIAAKKGVCV